MEYIAHRINTISELKQTDSDLGVELDLHSYKNKLIINHDPFIDGEDFEEYLTHYKHGTLILNIKEEGLEWKCLELLEKFNVRDYFFLDSSIPIIHKLIQKNNKNVAVRFSKYEPLEFVLNFKNLVNWVWVDCFEDLILNQENFSELKTNNFKICLVSPELQNQNNKIEDFAQQLKRLNIFPDAICTKKYSIELWKNMLNQ